MKETLHIENPRYWNTAVSSSLIEEWSKTMSEGISAEALQFHQACAPPNTIKLPRLVGFWDGSSLQSSM